MTEKDIRVEIKMENRLFCLLVVVSVVVRNKKKLQLILTALKETLFYLFLSDGIRLVAEKFMTHSLCVDNLLCVCVSKCQKVVRGHRKI